MNTIETIDASAILNAKGTLLSLRTSCSIEQLEAIAKSLWEMVPWASDKQAALVIEATRHETEMPKGYVSSAPGINAIEKFSPGACFRLTEAQVALVEEAAREREEELSEPAVRKECDAIMASLRLKSFRLRETRDKQSGTVKTGVTARYTSA